MKELKFDLRDITIVPSVWSVINSRAEIDINLRFGNSLMLPLMAAPMDTVVSEENIDEFILNGIIPVIPRGIRSDIHTSQFFQSFGLQEIEQQLSEYANFNMTPEFAKFENILIDIANGHMKKLLNLIKLIKSSFPNIKLMVGNIANPYTYHNLADAGADYIRCGIGGGSVCTTSANVAIHYPMGSLITECKKIKTKHNLSAKIVADGGMQGYDDIIKSLALGADIIMVGSLFNKARESAGFNYLKTKLGFIRIKNERTLNWLYNNKYAIYKKYRGMSTKSVQKRWGKEKLTTAEGITKYQKIEYTLMQWTDNFKDYLRSTMSYTDSITLEEFIGKVDYIFITENSFNRFKK